VSEYNGAVFRKDEIRAAGQHAVLQAEAVAAGMQGATDNISSSGVVSRPRMRLMLKLRCCGESTSMALS